jgi:hypothetical protein
MNKLLSILFAFVLISCTADNKDIIDERSTDPLIGTWGYAEDNITGKFIINSNGNYTLKYSDDDEQTGIWSNTGKNFSSTRQIYTFQESQNNGGEIDTATVVFSNDFNTWYWSDDEESIWTRQ